MSMKYLKKRIIRQRIQREAESRVETRDAILWDVLPGRKCRIKIQNSNTLITAFYPENWEQTPQFLKPRTAVKVIHTKGNRNRIEIIGFGSSIPTPIDGPMFPNVSDGPDAVLDGGQLFALETPSMKVGVLTGIIRIGSIIYTLDAMQATEDNIADAGTGVLIDVTAGVVAIDAAHSSLFRIDLISVGADLVIDYTKGTASTAPTVPNLAAGHVMLGTVLLPPGVTSITGEYLNKTFVPPVVSQISANPNSVIFDIGDPISKNITISVLDQYRNAIIGSRWGVTATIVGGTGFLDAIEDVTTIYKRTNTTSNTLTFTYRRNPLASPEIGGVINFELEQDNGITFIIPFDFLADFSGI